MQTKDRINKLQGEFRNLKLSIITGEIDIKLNNSIMDRVEAMDFIINSFPSDILTGSIALRLYGLLDRYHNDIDIIINDSKRYPSYEKEKYGDEESDFIDSNRLGTRTLAYKSGIFSKKKLYEVDFFENIDTKYQEVIFKRKKFKIQEPLEILNHKMIMASNNSSSSTKHLVDLECIFRKYNELVTIY